MASEFLASHGIDIKSFLPSNASQGSKHAPSKQTKRVLNARLPQHDPSQLWDLILTNGKIEEIEPANDGPPIAHLPGVLDAKGGLLVPPLCHAHIHLDRAFLLSDPKYADLEIESGDFHEALEMTNKAKARFDEEDLLRRGRRLIEKSMEAGVTTLRAFVEVDEIVELRCVRAAEQLKREFAKNCHIQICAFAQLALFTSDKAELRRRLLREAMLSDDVDVIGSTPYVEGDRTCMEENVRWTIDQALTHQKHLDFHLDYHLDPNTQPMVWYVVEQLQSRWSGTALPGKTICFGHCTRLTLFTDEQWQGLREKIGSLPVALIGLPTSDLFMMGRLSDNTHNTSPRVRGTLPIPQLSHRYGFNTAIAINNVDNAFTPQGNCDPLSIASLGVGVYQTARKVDVELLFECISSRARAAIGLGTVEEKKLALSIETGTSADLLLLSGDHGKIPTVSRAVFDPTSLARRIIK